jgi:hypothetical protein
VVVRVAEHVRSEELSFEEGEFLVRLARRAVEYRFERGKKMEPSPETPERLRRPGTAFVTITVYHTYEHRELRGCVGYVNPVKSLVETVIDVALEAAFRDPRRPMVLQRISPCFDRIRL